MFILLIILMAGLIHVGMEHEKVVEENQRLKRLINDNGQK